MITFISKDSSDTVLIGGQSNMSGADYGHVGPFPRYSISREDLATGDGTYIGSKHTITITGTAVIKTTDTQDMLTAGQRQMRVQGEGLTALHFNRDALPLHSNGKLTIAPYGGLGNNIVFNDARLTGLELPEQNEDTAGVQNLEYSFTFEAHTETSAASTNTGAAPVPDTPDYKLSSAEESWELTPNDAQSSFQGNDVSNNAKIYKTWTLTHTLSATGLKKFNSGANLATDGEAWKQAVEYVGSRLVDNPKAKITSDIMNNTNIESEFNAFYMDKDGDTENLGYDLDDFLAFNHVRTVSSDQGAGSYSVTDTWIISEENQPVTHDIEVSLEVDQEAKGNVVTVSGTIQGLSKTNPDENKDDKYTNALTALDAVLGKTFDAANTVYGAALPTSSNPLRNVMKSKSVGHSKVSGTITFNVTYDDIPVTTVGAVREEVNITYDNWDSSNQKVAIIGVIDNIGGPVIQSMGTTDEKKISVSVDIVMDRDHRTTKPDGTSLALTYVSTDIIDQFRQSKSETWNPFTGSYNLSLAWVGTLGGTTGGSTGTGTGNVGGGVGGPTGEEGCDEHQCRWIGVCPTEGIINILPGPPDETDDPCYWLPMTNPPYIGGISCPEGCGCAYPDRLPDFNGEIITVSCG
jgi:hypothetical protein